MVNMNMIVNKSDLVGYEAVDRTELKKKALAKIVAAWESKQAKNAARFGGLGFLAVSLAACNSSSDDTTTTTATTTTETTTPTVTALTKALATTADVVTSTFTSANDTVTATDTTFGAGDVLVDGSSTDSDTLTITMAGNAMATAPATVTGIENIVYNYASNVAANETNINLGNIIGANVTVNHTGNALVAPNASEIINIGPNMTVSLGTNIDTATIDATDPTAGPFGGTESAMHVAASATNVTLNAGASALYVVTGASVDGLTVNGGTGGALTVAAGATSKNITVNSGTGAGAVTVDLNSASTSAVNTGYTGTTAQTITVNNIATAATVTVGKTGTATSATNVTLDGTAAATDTATVSAPGIITFETRGTEQVEVLSLSGNGAAATYNLDGTADQPLSTTFTGSQSVTYGALQAQIVGHSTGITDSTTAGTTTVKMLDAADTGDYSKILPDVIELTTTTTGTNTLTFKDGQAIKLSTNAHTTAFNLDITDGATTDTTTGTMTVDYAVAGSNGAITINGTNDVIGTLNVVMSVANTVTLVGGTTTKIDASGAVATTFSANTTGTSLDAADMTGAVTATLNAGLKSITTGSGDDTINATTVPAASSVVNGGAGNDQYVVTSNDHTNVTFSGIEVIDVSGVNAGVAFKASQLSGANYIIKGTGTNDVLTMNGTATAAHVDLSSIDLSTISFDNTTTPTLINVSAFDTSKFLSSQSFNITGSNNVDTITGSANDDTINGGTGADVISGGNGSDSINGGAGADQITFTMETAKADTLTGGADNDTFIQAGTPATAAAAKITDFDAGTVATTKDILQISEAMVEGLTVAGQLTDTSNNDDTAGANTVFLMTADGDTVTTGNVVVLKNTYANDAAALAGIKTAGSDTITYASALDDNDTFLVVYTDGTNSYVAAATASAANTGTSEGVDSLSTLVELTGFTGTSNLNDGDIAIIA